MSYLGIDVGTSACKVGLLDDTGHLSTCTIPIPAAGKAIHAGEINPEVWWESTVEAICGLNPKALASVEAVAAIGNTPTLVLVDSTGHPTTNALLWSDTRATGEALQLLDERSQSEWNEIFGGYIPMTGGYPAAKLRWISRNNPEALRQADAILQPKDYVNLRLTGERCGDFWTSKGMISLDPSRREAPLLAMGLPPRLIPFCREANQVMGTITREAHQLLGVPQGIPVMAGWSDTLGAVLSLMPVAGEAFILSGTSDSIGILAPHRAVQSSQVLVAPVWDSGLDIVYGPTTTGMATMNWALESLGWDNMESFLIDARRGRTADAPIFVPYLGGQRSPVWNDRVRASWTGMGFDTTRSQIAYAILEGVIWAEFDVLRAVEDATGSQSAEILVTGGGSRMAFFNEVRSAMGGRIIQVAATEPVLGAALLAYYGLHAEQFPPNIRTIAQSVHHNVMANWHVPAERLERYQQAKRNVLRMASEGEKI